MKILKTATFLTDMKKPLNTDHARAQFKKRAKQLLAPLEREYGIDITFGRLDQNNGWRMRGARMMLRFDPTLEPAPTSPGVSVYEKDTTNIWDSPAAVALVNAMTKKPRLEIYRCLDAASFCPRIAVRKDGEPWFSFSAELIQDVQHGDWAGMFGPAQRTRSLVDTFREIGLGFQQEFPNEKELVAEAMEMIAAEYIQRVETEQKPFHANFR
jgi:hypothetical protein